MAEPAKQFLLAVPPSKNNPHWNNLSIIVKAKKFHGQLKEETKVESCQLSSKGKEKWGLVSSKMKKG